MGRATPLVHLLVVQARGDLLRGRGSSSSDTLSALTRLGGEVSVETTDDVASCLELALAGRVQLVIMDRCRGDDVATALESLREKGPPVVVVTGDKEEETALDAFRLGAADCIRVGADYNEVLPVVALEQIRRWRRLREREEARQQIRWLERLHRAIVSEIPASLLVIEGDGRIVTANPECSRALGVDVSAAIGSPLAGVLPEELLGSCDLLEQLKKCRSGSVPGPSLARLLHSDGQERIFDVRLQRLDEDGRVLLVLSDLTEQKLLAKRVDRLRKYNENIIHNINSALLVVENTGKVAFANPRAEVILGVGRGELVGRVVWDWFSGASRDRVHIARTLESGTPVKGAETVISRDDGSVVPIGISCTPLADSENEAVFAVAIFQDLTEIKQLQRQVLQTEKMASIGQLAAGVAHEINNPMGFIHANLFQMSEYISELHQVWEKVDALRAVVDSGDLSELKLATDALTHVSGQVDIDFVLEDFSKAVRESQEGSERIRHIVRDLRDFSHPDTAEPTLADVNQCVDSTASIVWTMMKHSVILEKDYHDLPRVRCFPMQLKQVFMNLLVNAYQSIQERVGDSGSTGEIYIRTRATESGVVVAIRDTGMGIASADLPRIFDPFFTTKEVGAGTGLGLSTSYSIVQRHGGTVRVSSEPDQGCTFEVWLPRDASLESLRAS